MTTAPTIIIMFSEISGSSNTAPGVIICVRGVIVWMNKNVRTSKKSLRKSEKAGKDVLLLYVRSRWRDSSGVCAAGKWTDRTGVYESHDHDNHKRGATLRTRNADSE